MAVQPIDGYTDAELDALDAAIHQERVDREIERQLAAEAVSAGISGALTKVKQLLGPESPTAAATTSVREIQLYTNAQMDSNAGLAHRLTFQALEAALEVLQDVILYVGNRP